MILIVILIGVFLIGAMTGYVVVKDRSHKEIHERLGALEVYIANDKVPCYRMLDVVQIIDDVYFNQKARR